MSWKLSIGCHRGTMVSRDFNLVGTKFHDSNQPLESLEDCIQCAKDWKNNYNSFGCYLWFATAIDPDGNKHPTIPGSPYR